MNFFSHARKNMEKKKKQEILKFRKIKNKILLPKNTYFSLKTCVFTFFYVQ